MIRVCCVGRKVGVYHENNLPSKGLGQLTQTMKRIDIRTLAITSNGSNIENDLVNSFSSRLFKVTIIQVKCHGVT